MSVIGSAGGTTVTLTETAFQGTPTSLAWSGCDSVSADQTTCTVSMNRLRTVILDFS